MEMPTDFMTDCRALSPGGFPATVKTHEGLVKVLASMIPTVHDAPIPLTTFGERVINDIDRSASYTYNEIGACKDAETTLLESLQLAQKGVLPGTSGHEVSAGRRVTIFTLANVPVAIQKNIRARTCYVLEGNAQYNLISHTIAKFTAPNFVYPSSEPGTILRVPLENSRGYFLFGRYATSTVSEAIREQLSSNSDVERNGLMLNHEYVVAATKKLLKQAVTFEDAQAKVAATT